MLTAEPLGQLDEVAAQLLEREAQSVPFCDPHHVVARRKMAPLLTEDLAHQALDPVPLMGSADLPRYGDSQPRGSQRWSLGRGRDLARGRLRNLEGLLRRRPSLDRARGDEDQEVARVVLLAFSLDAKKLPSSAQSQPTRESQRLHRASAVAHSISSPGYFEPVLTVRRLRPLRRRAARTLRPFLVAMRARKPWVRLRRVLCGW